MKLISTALLAAGLASLAACGGGAANNTAANNVTEEVNLGTEDLGGNVGNEASLNGSADNGAGSVAADNGSAGNASGNGQ